MHEYLHECKKHFHCIRKLSVVCLSGCWSFSSSSSSSSLTVEQLKRFNRHRYHYHSNLHEKRIWPTARHRYSLNNADRLNFSRTISQCTTGERHVHHHTAIVGVLHRANIRLDKYHNWNENERRMKRSETRQRSSTRSVWLCSHWNESVEDVRWDYGTEPIWSWLNQWSFDPKWCPWVEGRERERKWCFDERCPSSAWSKYFGLVVVMLRGHARRWR